MTTTIDTKDLKKLFENKEPMTLLDVRRKADYQANPKTIKGAVWCDPEKIDDWITQLPIGRRAVVYCVKGGSVSKSVTDRLRGEKFDVVFLEGGLKHWIESGQSIEEANDSIHDTDINLLRQTDVS
jgi:rhodanese-related sulfurtransferase